MDTALPFLKKYYGYERFRPLQGEIIETIMSGRDTLVLMPTGGGKSVCFQIPAVMREGLGLVVSPLISLMKDQVDALRGNGIEAAFLNSTLSSADEARIVDDALGGRLKLLYISPERAVSEMSRLLPQLPISLIAIDEAHCISAWGHDFRPEYAQLGVLKAQFPHIPIIALTATAEKVTRRDIIERLSLHDPAVFVASFDRPNLSLTVRQSVPKKEKMREILRFIEARPSQSGIIYCLSRNATEEVSRTTQMGAKSKLRRFGGVCRRLQQPGAPAWRVRSMDAGPRCFEG